MVMARNWPMTGSKIVIKWMREPHVADVLRHLNPENTQKWGSAQGGVVVHLHIVDHFSRWIVNR
jgi:hypothetical protein